jgi:ABC-2 type transport system permease protein
MLWYKAWLETRWRFLIGLVLLVCSAAAIVLVYTRVMGLVQPLVPLVPSVDAGSDIGRELREAADLLRSYRGYIWSQWFRQNMPQIWAIFAVMLGTGGLLTQTSRGGALYTLSMPVSRARLVGVRAATGLGELLVLAIVPTLVLPLLSPLVGQTYGVGDAVVHGACLFIRGAVFFSLAFLLSTVFADVWRPALIAVCALAAVGFVEQVFHDALPTAWFHVMSAESYFRGGGVPWPGLIVSALVSTAMLYGAVENISRRDF